MYLLDIDVKSLFIMVFWVNVTAVLAIGAYTAFVDKRFDRLAKHLIIAKSFQALAFCLLVQRNAIADVVSINLGNTLLFLSFYYEASCMLTLMKEEKQRYYTFEKVVTAFCALGFNAAELLFPSPAVRITVSSACVFAILALPCLCLLLSPHSSRFKRCIGGFYAAFLLMLLPRIAYSLGYRDAGLFTNHPSQRLAILSLVVMVVFSLSACLLLRKEDNDSLIVCMATTDCLTGLANRYEFLDAAEQRFRKCRHEQTRVGILYLDLDHFKRVNDTYGHAFGDVVLVRFAEIIRSACRNADLSCRYGGEEFVVLIAASPPDTAYTIASRIMGGVRRASFAEHPEFSFTVSIGLVEGVPARDDDLTAAINRADKALYEAKHTGRNKIVVHPSA